MPQRPGRARGVTGVRGLLALVVPLVVLLAGCSGDAEGSDGDLDPAAVDSTEVPELGTCRVLSPEDVAQPTNATATVDCTEPHTAETFAVGQLPTELDDAAYDDPELGKFAYATCGEAFRKFLGVDESRVMRSLVSWAWFRPSEDAWAEGARWYRCDAVGGGESSTSYVELPETAKGLLRGAPKDEWSVCADGETVAESEKVPCTEPHTWRAVATVPVGEKGDEWPGERIVEVTSRDSCSGQAGAWLNYPPEYDFGWTSFGEGQWEAGNRRSICWARTDR